MDKKSSVESPRKSSRWIDQYADFVSKTFHEIFSWNGHIVASYPWSTIAMMIIVSLLFSLGITNLNEESRGDKLWVPQNTRAVSDRKLYESFFQSSRREFLIAEPIVGTNILTKSNMQEVMKLYEEIRDLEVVVGGNTESLRTLCVRDNSFGEPCLIVSVLENWFYNSTILNSEADDSTVLATVNSGNSVDYLKKYLGGVSVDTDGNVISAEAVMMSFFIRENGRVVDGTFSDPEAEAWEQAYLDYLLNPSASPTFPQLKVYPEAVRSLSDEFGGAIGADIQLVTYAYIILFLYVAVNIGKVERTCVKMRLGLSFSVILTVGLSIVSSYGLASACGFIFTPLHSLLPFVLLGIGVDDSFVIAEAFDAATNNGSIQERVAEALGHAGVSVTITSATDMVAFAISSITSLPALSSFSVYATFGIVFLYLYQITFFTAALTIDAMRQASYRKDVFCCFKSSSASSASDVSEIEMGKTQATNSADKQYQVVDNNSAPNEGNGKNVKVILSYGKTEEMKGMKGMNYVLRHYYAPFLMNSYVKIIVICGFIALIIVCILGATKLRVESNERSFIPDGSYLLDTLDKQDEYFGENGVEVDIVTYDYDHFANQDVLGVMQITLDGYQNRSPFLKDPFGPSYDSWYTTYTEQYLPSLNGSISTDGNGRPLIESEFYNSLKNFLYASGIRYNSSVVRSADGNSIRATKIEIEYQNFNKFTNGELRIDTDKAVKAMDDLRSICDNFDVPVFPWTYEYTQWESYKIIERELYLGLGFSLMAVVIIICFLIGSPTTCLLISFSIISTIICILGVMFYWDLVIDNVAVINLILAVGLAVDYSAHIGHTFMLKKGSKDERAIEAIGSIGAAVLNGALSTFLAVVLLSASESYVFRVLFKQFFATVVLGVGHGLILLPVLLSIVGPAPFSSAEEIRTYEKLSIERSSANERKNSNSQVTPAAVVYEGVNEETPNGTVVLTSENETNI